MKSRMRFLTVPTVVESYQYDGYENQVLMAPNYAESVAAVPMPMIFHQNVVNTPVTEVQTPIAATATVSQNGFLSFQVLLFFFILLICQRDFIAIHILSFVFCKMFLKNIVPFS